MPAGSQVTLNGRGTCQRAHATRLAPPDATTAGVGDRGVRSAPNTLPALAPPLSATGHAHHCDDADFRACCILRLHCTKIIHVYSARARARSTMQGARTCQHLHTIAEHRRLRVRQAAWRACSPPRAGDVGWRTYACTYVVNRCLPPAGQHCHSSVASKSSSSLGAQRMAWKLGRPQTCT